MSFIDHKYFILTPFKRKALKYFSIPLILTAPLIMQLHQTWNIPVQAIFQGIGFYAFSSLILIGVLASDKRIIEFGVANCITLIRLFLTAILACSIGFLDLIPTAGMWWLSCLAFITLLLDGADGWVARHLGNETHFGARFDLEVDAALILVLSLMVRELPHIGNWVLLAGCLRYVFVWASWPFPALRTPLAPSFRRKLICVLQTLALITALCPLVNPQAGRGAVAIAVILLLLSFVRDILQLLLSARRR